MPRSWRPSWIVFGMLFGLPAAHAQTKTLAGEWQATPLRADWAVGDWGAACGPRPSGSGAPGGTVQIRQSGTELTFSGAGRTYSTTECWEQFPGLARVSHSAGARNFRNVCKTPPKDPRQATIITTVSATDNQITFDETGQYQFVIENQNCTASVRRTRFLRLVRREGEAPAEPEPAPAPAPEPQPQPPAVEKKPTPRLCTAPGDPARLEVRPSRKLLRAGESFTFRASVVDKAGCPLSLTPTFRLVGSASGVELVGPGTVHAGDAAPEGEVKLLASVGDRSVTVVAEVVSRERYDAILQGGQFDDSGESAEAAVTRIESSSIGARNVVLRDEGSERRKLFVAIVGTAALLLGVIGLVAVRRARRQQPAAASRRRPSPAPSSGSPTVPVPVQSRPRVTPAPSSGGKGMVCPTCREEYPPDARFCANDANRLVPVPGGIGPMPAGGVCPTCGQGYDPGVATCPKHDEPLVPAAVYAAALERKTTITRKICPVCGSQFAGESQFCGKCGAALVPVN